MLLRSVVQLVRGGMQSVSRVPLFVWIYIAFVWYLYRRMTRDFFGVGTRNTRVLGRATVSLTKEEESLSAHIIDPSSLNDTFDDVGGLEDVKQALREHVIWPFRHPDLFSSSSLRALPTGILLWGPPGTGKTLLARALAKEIKGYFIEVCIENMFSKWVGESEKLAAAIFSLAEKLQPCVIFIDEVDSLLASRSADDNSAYLHTKTIFMSKWDGLQGQNNRTIVVGASNRPSVLDIAILRRFPIKLSVPVPNQLAREKILRIHLACELARPDSELNVEVLASATCGYSGADLRELCKAAALGPVREAFDLPIAPKSASLSSIRMEHFLEAMKKVKPLL